MSVTTKRKRTAKLPPPPPRRRGSALSTFFESWRAQPASLRVLRAFLGVTFVYAGIQKLADPNFLHTGTPGFIGNQLRAFAQGSPIAGVLRALDHTPDLTGVAIAVAEIAIGIGTLAGIAPVLFALGGFLVNLSLTLSATWHVHPYFLGSDSIYAAAWFGYGVGVLEVQRRTRRATTGRKTGPVHAVEGLTRREFMRGAALAGATLATAGVAASLAGSPAAAKPFARAAGGATTAPAGSSGPTGASGGAVGAGGAASAGTGTAIADLSQIPVGGAIGFQAPGVGPAALVRLGQNDVVAYSRVCTHAGCLVGYDSSSRILFCPCHGAEFDPARNATPIAGPAPSPLAPVDVAIDPATGKVVLPE